MNEEYLIVASMGISIFYIVHIFITIHVRRNHYAGLVSVTWSHAWSFWLVTLVLPVLLSVISTQTIQNADFDVSSSEVSALTYDISISVFVVMITIELSYLFVAQYGRWTQLVLAALVIDLSALFTFLRLGAGIEFVNTSWASPIFYSIVGASSFASSLLTVYLGHLIDRASTENEHAVALRTLKEEYATALKTQKEKRASTENEHAVALRTLKEEHATALKTQKEKAENAQKELNRCKSKLSDLERKFDSQTNKVVKEGVAGEQNHAGGSINKRVSFLLISLAFVILVLGFFLLSFGA